MPRTLTVLFIGPCCHQKLKPFKFSSSGLETARFFCVCLKLIVYGGPKPVYDYEEDNQTSYQGALVSLAITVAPFSSATDEEVDLLDFADYEQGIVQFSSFTGREVTVTFS